MFKSKTLDHLNIIFSFLPKARKKQFFSLVPIAIFAGTSEVIVLGILARLFSFIVGEPRKSLPLNDFFNFDPKYKLLTLIIIFVLSNWFASFIKLYLRAKQLKLKATIWRDLSELALKKLLSQKYEFFISNDRNEFSASVLVNITRVADIVVLPVLQTISGAFVIIFISCAILLIAKSTALYLVLGLLFGYLVISLTIIPYLRIANKKRFDLEIQSNNALQESLKSIVDVKLTNSEIFFFENYKLLVRKAIPFIWRGETLPEIPRALVEPFGITLIFFIGIVPLLLTSEIEKISSVIPFLATIAAASLKLTPPLQDTFRGYNSIRGGLPDLEATTKLITSTKEFKEDIKFTTKSTFKNSDFKFPSNNIALNNVYYKYPNSSSYVINNLSLKIKTGSRIAFVGSTGSGKTTTANLILQLLLPQKGNLLLDNKLLLKEDVKKWQYNCAYVPQTFYLNNCTILENIAFASDVNKVNLDAVWESLESAKLTEFVKNMPKSIYTNISENGLKLSGGQRQRLAIARAFYRNSKLLVLDEATSALDNKTESEVMSSIDLVSNNCTLIIIAHRLSTVMNADMIYEFNNGQIIHSGTFKELCIKSDSFKDLKELEKKILQ